MQAVILAGGQGTRLRPLTSTCPKPLLPIANVPMIHRIVDKLPDDVDEVLLAVNYKLDMLRDYFARLDVGRTITVVEEKEPLGTAGAIKNVEPHIDGPFLVFNGDILDSLDIDVFRRFHARRKGAGTISLWQVADPRQFGVMEMKGERIMRFVEKPETKEQAPSNLANAGTYLLEPAIFDLIKPATLTSIERETFPALLSSGAALYGYPFEGYWVDCGRPESFLKANETLLRHGGRTTLVGEHTVNRGARFEEWAVVGARCHLGADVEISRSVLLDGVTVGSNVTIKDSIVAAGVQVEDDAVLVDCVVGEGARVPKGVLLKSMKIDAETGA